MYHIIVGRQRPQTIKLGSIERNTGSSIIKEHGETLAKRGDTGFPNGTKIWAVRVIDGVAPKPGESAIAVTDPKYKGEIKRLPWGSVGGSLIDVRYLKGYPSLDVLYQDRILNFKIDETNENTAEVFMIMLPNGENDIDENIDPLLVEHLKGHSYNRDSKSKDPSFNSHMFYEKSFEQQERLDSQILDEKFEAGKVVREAGTGGDTLNKCKNLLSIVKTVTDEEPEDSGVYAYLKMIADKKPVAFLKAVNDYKVKVSNVFEKLKSYEAVDLTKDGVIVVGQKKKEIVITDLPAKGEQMFMYLLENFTEPEVFNATYKLIQISDNLK